MNDRREYRYTPPGTGQCPDHPYCAVVRCHRFLCGNLIHLPLNRPGQPRRFCSTTCRVAEHRQLRK